MSVVLGVALIMTAARATAIQPPHDFDCVLCHGAHIQPSGFLATATGNANLCLSCHNPTGTAAAMPFSAGDSANPFGTRSGSSHSWNVAAEQPWAGASLPRNDALAPKVIDGRVLCSTCHEQHFQLVSKPFLRMPNTDDAMCLDCHRERALGPWSADPVTNIGSHPVSVPIPSTNDNFRQPQDGETYLPLKNGCVVCTTCHAVHYATSTETRRHTAVGGSADARSATVTGVDWTPGALVGREVVFPNAGANHGKRRFIASNGTNELAWIQPLPAQVHNGDRIVLQTPGLGDGMLLRAPNDSELCQACHTYPDHPTSTPLHSCRSCHDPHGTDNILLVASQINGHAVVFNGLASTNFVHGAPRYDGLCEVCHTVTAHHRNNASGDHTHGVDRPCIECHTHEKGFEAQWQCGGCHKATAATLVTGSHGSHFSAAQGPELTNCSICHGAGADEGTHPGHINGIVNFNGKADETLATTEVCSACHSPGGIFDGVGQPVTGAKANWSNGVYTAAGELRPGLEGWCIGCHDDDPGTPENESAFVHGVWAPAMAGDGATFGFYVTGHGRVGEDYAAQSWQAQSAAGNPPGGVVCVVCHDARERHTDGVAQSGTRLRTGFAPDQLNGACGRCHDSGGTASHAPHYSVDGAEFELSAHARYLCTTCHNVHGSAGPYPAMATGREEALCYVCHTAVNTEFGGAHHHDISDSDQAVSGARLECTMCHNPHVATKNRPLVNPDNPASIWTAASPRDFCLACHDGDPPAAVTFPSASPGTGWDQSAFAGSRHDVTLGGDCTLCHSPHGTDHRSILLANYAVADPTAYSTGAYQLCFNCHDAGKTVTGENAFKEYHKNHVSGKQSPCIACHNVHAPRDAGESGLIDFTFPAAHGYLTLNSGYTLSTAFTDNGSNAGSCSVKCHSTEHSPRSYTGKSATTVDCLQCHLTQP